MGFASIAAHAEEELRPHLPKMVPRLFLLKYDPNPRIAESMRNIWGSLVKDNKVVEELFEGIVGEVLTGLGDRQWRKREARYVFWHYCRASSFGLGDQQRF